MIADCSVKAELLTASLKCPRYFALVDTVRSVCNNSGIPHDKPRSFERSITAKMSENESAITEEASATETPAADVVSEDISYHAVEKDGVVTAIWEMQGRKHVRTIDPRSRQGQDILRLYTTEHHDETVPAADASEAAASS
jgi:hypothetical protein